jgi:hypothetical protein
LAEAVRGDGATKCIFETGVGWSHGKTEGAGLGGFIGPGEWREVVMVAAVEVGSASLAHLISSGIGKIVAALLVAAVAYVLAAAAMSLARRGNGGETRGDLAGLCLMTTLVVYLLVSRRLDVTWFEIVSAGVIGLAVLGIVLGEAMAIATRLHMHGH